MEIESRLPERGLLAYNPKWKGQLRPNIIRLNDPNNPEFWIEITLTPKEINHLVTQQ